MHAKGVRLRGVRISGRLDLESAALRCPLRLENCYLGNPRPVMLDYATVSLLALTGCYLAGLTGDMLKVAKELDLSRSRFTRPLVLTGAEITGQLNCSGAHLTGTDADGVALTADGMKAGGDVFLDEGFTAAGTVRLAGADLTGQLKCSGAHVTGTDADGVALAGDRLKVGDNVFLDEGFTAAGGVWLVSTEIGGALVCRGAELAGPDHDGNALTADRLKVDGNVLLSEGFTTAGAVRLSSADIAGQLTVSGARLAGADTDGNALVADWMKVGGAVFLEDGFTAAGTVRLPGADISGSLICSGAQLTGTDPLAALFADEIRVGGDVFLDEGFTAAGAVRLPGAEITGQLTFSGACLAGTDVNGIALLADWMKAGGAVHIDEGFTAAGALSLSSVRIDGLMCLMPAELAGEGKTALDATGAQIAHELLWAPSQQVTGLVILEDASVGQLEDDWTRASGGWPPADQGLLLLDGFIYSRFGGQHLATLEQRLGWIGSRPKSAAGSSRSGFATQPYQQLAKVYHHGGQEAEARMVAIARRRDLRHYGDLSRPRRAGNWLLDVTIRYGYQTWRAVAGLAAVYVAVLAIFWLAQYRTALIVPAPGTADLRPAPAAARCTSSYPCFSPVGYAIDTVIALINIHQADYWRTNASAPDGWVLLYVSWTATGLGWALATLIVTGFTGLVRRYDAP